MEENKSFARFELNGEINTLGKGKQITFRKVNFNIYLSKDYKLEYVELKAIPDTGSIPGLKADFPSAGLPDSGPFTCTFEMKNTSIEKLKVFPFRTTEPKDFIMNANAALLKLENYDCKGFTKDV